MEKKQSRIYPAFTDHTYSRYPPPANSRISSHPWTKSKIWSLIQWEVPESLSFFSAHYERSGEYHLTCHCLELTEKFLCSAERFYRTLKVATWDVSTMAFSRIKWTILSVYRYQTLCTKICCRPCFFRYHDENKTSWRKKIHFYDVLKLP